MRRRLITTDPRPVGIRTARARRRASHDPRRGDDRRHEGDRAATSPAQRAGDRVRQTAHIARRSPRPGGSGVRLSIAGMLANLSRDQDRDAGRIASICPSCRRDARPHIASLFHNLVTAGRLDEAADVLAETASAGRVHRRRASILHAQGSRRARSSSGRPFGRVFRYEMIVTAHRDGTSPADGKAPQAGYTWARRVLSGADQYEQAMGIASDGIAAAPARPQGMRPYQMFETVAGRILLETGQISRRRPCSKPVYRARGRTQAGLCSPPRASSAHASLRSTPATRARLDTSERLARSCSSKEHRRCVRHRRRLLGPSDVEGRTTGRAGPGYAQ